MLRLGRFATLPFSLSPISIVMKTFPLIATGVLLAVATVLRATSPSVTYGGETYVLGAVHEGREDKDPTVMLFSPADNAGRDTKTVLEVVHWPKKKYPDELGRSWLESIFPRCVETPTVHVSPKDKRDVTYEAIAFFQNPSGQENDLRRFFREPGRGGVTSYLVKWLFLEKDSKVDDSLYRSRRDALIKELQGLTISLDWRPERPVTAPAAAEPKPAAKS